VVAKADALVDCHLHFSQLRAMSTPAVVEVVAKADQALLREERAVRA
jgi:hypothetical protein